MNKPIRLRESLDDILSNKPNPDFDELRLYQLRERKLRIYLREIKNTKLANSDPCAVSENNRLSVALESQVESAYQMYRQLVDSHGTDGSLRSILEKLLDGVKSKNFGTVVADRKYLITLLISATKQYQPNSIAEMVYIVLKGQPHANKCGKTPLFNSYELGYRKFCGDKTSCRCNKEEHSAIISRLHEQKSEEEKRAVFDKIKQTCVERYGVENPMQSSQVVEKLKEGNLFRTGYEWGVKNPEVRQKMKETCQKRYGVDTPFQSAEIQSKVAKTTLQRYGSFMTHAREKLSEIYDGKNPFETDEVKKKAKQTMLAKYDVEHYSSTDAWGEQVKATLSERYGRTNAAQLNMSDSVYNFLQDRELFCETVIGRTSVDVAKEIGTKTSSIILGYARKYGVVDQMKFDPPSAMEEVLVEFLSGLNIQFKRRDRTVLGNRLEIDILLKENNVGIELHGLEIHSEILGKKDRNYHYSKYEKSLPAGVTLLQFFSSDFWSKLPIVKHLILEAINYQLPVISDKNCSIKEIDCSLGLSFLNSNYTAQSVHVCADSFSVGAFYNNELCSVVLYSVKEKLIVIDHFCSKINNRYNGVFRSIVSYILEKHPNVKTIEAHSNNMLNEEKLLIDSGFVFVGEIDVDYFLTNDYRTLKSKTCFPNATWEIMQSMGYDRVWDAGKKKWTHQR